VILAVDDDPDVLVAVTRDLRFRFGDRYRVMHAGSGAAALELLGDVRRRGEQVALLMADQRMSEMEGTAYLLSARELAPGAKRVLLTAYADTAAAIAAINQVGLDYYLIKPWDPPEDELYPVLEDLLAAWEAHSARTAGGLRMIGHRYSRESHALRDFLARNRVPARWLDIERDTEARELLTAAGVSDRRLPIAFLEDGSLLAPAGIQELAQRLKPCASPESDHYDLVIVGGGPAGLAAAVYGASEGLRTVLVERDALGGQAGRSSRIENYLGFPVGLSGSDLARRATDQARRLGAELLVVHDAVALHAEGTGRIIEFSDGRAVSASTVIVATGVSYRELTAPGFAQYTNAGIYYGAALCEAPACQDRPVAVIGGANSAGQAAVYFAQFASTVSLIVRGDDLEKSMSTYLIEQIAAIPNIVVRTGSQAVAAEGVDGRFRGLQIRDGAGAEQFEEVEACFILIGAEPPTAWLDGVLARDASGYIESGLDVRGCGWPLQRDPYFLETSVPGVFVAGDVRARSIKRVASAVGEGSMAVSLIHDYLSAA
jgi:thioredoxin reductase (NADPH)